MISHDDVFVLGDDLSSEKVGGKAYNLSKLVKAGFPVPKGLVILSSDIIGNNDCLPNILSDLQFPLIVRSSAGIEDGALASFAGQFESFGSLTSYKHIAEALKKVSTSLSSKKLISYLSHFNIDKKNVAINVVVQEYIKPVYSGVLFIGGVAHLNNIIIEYSRNDSGVVSGSVPSERLVVDYKTGEVVEYVSLRGGIETDTINKLVTIAKEIQSIFDYPQDIEWVYDGNDIYIVQARPITVKLTNSPQLVQDELTRLKEKFGEVAPNLTSNQFADGVGEVSPLTVSLFHKIFSTTGPWGRVYKKYGYRIPDFMSSDLVPVVFGRLYYNNTLENKLLYSKLPFVPANDKESFKWKLKGLLKKIPYALLYLCGVIKLRFDAFLYFKNIDKEVVKLADVRVEEADIKTHLDNILNHIMPALFKLSLYNQFVESYLKKKIFNKVSETDWRIMMRTGVVDSMSKIINDETLSFDKKKRLLSHRGLMELELSNHRFGTSNDDLLFLAHNSPHISAKLLKIRLETIHVREKCITKFPSFIDQQIISTFFTIHEAFAEAREDIHNIWVWELSAMHCQLKDLDGENKLYNTIWGLSIDEVIFGDLTVDKDGLLEVLRENHILAHMSLPSIISPVPWGDIFEPKIGDMTSGLQGVGVSQGIVTGVVGSVDDLHKGLKVDILIVTNLDPSLTVYFDKIKGIVAEVGGKLSHAALVAREYGLPVVVLDMATELLKTGDTFTIDGEAGVVKDVVSI